MPIKFLTLYSLSKVKFNSSGRVLREDFRDKQCVKGKSERQMYSLEKN